jgi:hypothetical protein
MSTAMRSSIGLIKGYLAKNFKWVFAGIVVCGLVMSIFIPAETSLEIYVLAPQVNLEFKGTAQLTIPEVEHVTFSNLGSVAFRDAQINHSNDGPYATKVHGSRLFFNPLDLPGNSICHLSIVEGSKMLVQISNAPISMEIAVSNLSTFEVTRNDTILSKGSGASGIETIVIKNIQRPLSPMFTMSLPSSKTLTVGTESIVVFDFNQNDIAGGYSEQID